jgi:GSCFA family
MQITNHITSKRCVDESIASIPAVTCQSWMKSPYVASAVEVMKNRQNPTAVWFKDGTDENDQAGKLAFQRLRQTWFTPHVVPKFKLRRDDAFYAIGSCFARGLEKCLQQHGIAVESAAPEFSKLQPAKERVTGLGFTNKYNTYSMLNELRWALDPQAAFPLESIVRLTATTWYDPHTNPTLSFADLEETLQRRALMHTVTKRIKNCRAVVVTLGLAEVWRDIHADVYLNCTPIPSLFESEPNRYEFHLTTFAQNWAKLRDRTKLRSCGSVGARSEARKRSKRATHYGVVFAIPFSIDLVCMLFDAA